MQLAQPKLSAAITHSLVQSLSQQKGSCAQTQAATFGFSQPGPK
jgi:hypothetical protein